MPIIDYEGIEERKDNKLGKFTIRIIDAIALCHIVDEFERFIGDLTEFSKGIKGYSNLNNLYEYIKDRKKVNKHVKDFYYVHYNVLNAIHKNAYISNFLLIYFNNKTGEFNDSIMQMYDYLKRNKKDKDIILANLNKLKELGFERIELDENLLFDDLVISFNNGQYSTIEYFDGDIRVIPSYHDLKYTVSNADYQISVSNNKSIAFRKNPEIALNNLVFESSKLPQSIEYDYLLNDLMSKRNNDFNTIINNSLRIGYDLNEINSLISNIEKSIETIKDLRDKDSALIHVSQMKETIMGLELFLQDYEGKLINNNDMTRDELNEEKRLYKNYRYNLKLDLD